MVSSDFIPRIIAPLFHDSGDIRTNNQSVDSGFSEGENDLLERDDTLGVRP
jgi:hypothetical protein